ncbi:MAG: hypothetical protein GTN89_10230 [Acidobacteria bacterium]|nr:hypothetical protein [Acidobacteriota bacterium]NIM61421.1 hypothetical protein [Acidobacteriota bacterium]NIO59632.1 hypothetical protein [Acidobacteriota bacterium]NIQ30729.1 hypothetical protein [Acidobacteriota bacterium]NIQ85725.1 hypothetical protein [Acidobacteriota bacterium]
MILTVPIAGMLWTGLLFGGPMNLADAPSCRRSAGNLTRYLVCREVVALSPEDPLLYYEALDRTERRGIDRLALMKRVRTGGPALAKMLSAGRGSVRYRPALLLTDVLQPEPGCADCSVLQADCDLLGVLNYGIAERFYGEQFASSGFGLVRTDPHHLIAAFSKQGRVTTVLETTDGSMHFDPRGVFDHEVRTAARSETYLRLMTEDEIIAMHLGSIGQRLRQIGRLKDALSHFDEALSLNGDEFFALRGRAEILLSLSTRRLKDAVSPFDDVDAPLLDAAETAIRQALRLDEEDPHSLFLLGAIRYFANDPENAHEHLRVAARGDSNPAYDYYLGLTRLQLGLNKKAMKSLKSLQRR